MTADRAKRVVLCGTSLLLAVQVALTACKGKGKERSREEVVNDDSKSEVEPADQLSEMRTSLRRLFPDDKPTWPNAFDPLRPGMSLSAARRIQDYSTEASFPLPGYPGLQFNIDRNFVPVVTGPSVGLPKSHSRQLVEELWGPPQHTSDVDDQAFWFNPAAHIRARLSDTGMDGYQKLTLSQYLPDEVLIDIEAEPFGEPTAKLLGRRCSEVDSLVRGSEIYLDGGFPPDLETLGQYSVHGRPTGISATTSVALYCDFLEKRLERIEWDIGELEEQDSLRDDLLARYGEPKESSGVVLGRWELEDGTLMVALRVSGGRATLEMAANP